MSVCDQTRQLKIVALFLGFSMAGCHSNDAKAGSVVPPNDISVSVERLSDIGAATRICELAAVISKKQSARFGECLSTPEVMIESLENEFVNAFQKNPDCKGIALIVGTDDPAKAATVAEQQRLQHAKYRLYFHLKVTSEGYVNWDSSDWQLERIAGGNTPVHGEMNNLEKQTSAFCTVVRDEGGTVR